jgi:hypothetical protein
MAPLYASMTPRKTLTTATSLASDFGRRRQLCCALTAELGSCCVAKLFPLMGFSKPEQIIGAAWISVVYATPVSTFVDRIWLIPVNRVGHRRPFCQLPAWVVRRYAPLVGTGLSKAASGYPVEVPVQQCPSAYLGATQ